MKDISSYDVQKNIPLVSRTSPDKKKSVVRVGNVEIGGGKVVVMAGPCTVENLDQLRQTAQRVKACGATILRGGAYKPMTFPYRTETAFELGEEGLKHLRDIKLETGLPVVTEVTDPRLVDKVGEVADMFQVGSRNMQNFVLLEELGKTRIPVLLKRHFGASMRDWLGAAEYLYHYGNNQVVLCERGIVAPHTHLPTSRFIADIQVIPAVHEFSHLPIILDPSHATFRRDYVASISRAGIAAGADGLIVEVHPTPEKAAVDPLQALSFDAFGILMDEIRGIASVLRRSV